MSGIREVWWARMSCGGAGRRSETEGQARGERMLEREAGPTQRKISALHNLSAL